MTTLELLEREDESSPFKFKSLGIIKTDYEPDEVKTESNIYKPSNDFPIDTTYELTDGKFPLTDYKDLFEKSNKYHTLNNDIKIKIIGFDNSCQEGQINKFGKCHITVEKATEEATGPATEEATTGGRKSKRRKSKRRKTNRRKSNRRR
jgi:hypothetical protein